MVLLEKANINTVRRGIILAGVSGILLYPATLSVSMQILPVYDKPMIFYPLTSLMMSRIFGVYMISSPQDTPRFEQLLEDCSRCGMNLSYCAQLSPGYLVHAFNLVEQNVGNNLSALVLGGNMATTSLPC